MDGWIVCCNPEIGLGKYSNAFGQYFTKEKGVASWEAVGVVLPTHACLKDFKVCRDIGYSNINEKTHIIMSKMEMANRMACELLTPKGFQGHFLMVELKKKKVVAQNLVMVPILMNFGKD